VCEYSTNKSAVGERGPKPPQIQPRRCGNGSPWALSMVRRIAALPLPDWIGGGGGWQANSSKAGRGGELSEKSLQNRASPGFPVPGRGTGWPLRGSPEPLGMKKLQKRARTEGMRCIVFGDWDDRMEVPFQND